jgi:hypothetical protein
MTAPAQHTAYADITLFARLNREASLLLCFDLRSIPLRNT